MKARVLKNLPLKSLVDAAYRTLVIFLYIVITLSSYQRLSAYQLVPRKRPFTFRKWQMMSHTRIGLPQHFSLIYSIIMKKEVKSARPIGRGGALRSKIEISALGEDRPKKLIDPFERQSEERLHRILMSSLSIQPFRPFDHTKRKPLIWNRDWPWISE